MLTSFATGNPCSGIRKGTIEFVGNITKLNAAGIKKLSQLAIDMNNNPSCNAVISGNGVSSKMSLQRSWDRVNAVINYLVEKKGIDRERFIFISGENGNESEVEFRSAEEGEEGPNMVAPPFPHLRK